MSHTFKLRTTKDLAIQIAENKRLMDTLANAVLECFLEADAVKLSGNLLLAIHAGIYTNKLETSELLTTVFVNDENEGRLFSIDKHYYESIYKLFIAYAPANRGTSDSAELYLLNEIKQVNRALLTKMETTVADFKGSYGSKAILTRALLAQITGQKETDIVFEQISVYYWFIFSASLYNLICVSES